jgi:hypothetical protein
MDIIQVDRGPTELYRMDPDTSVNMVNITRIAFDQINNKITICISVRNIYWR